MIKGFHHDHTYGNYAKYFQLPMKKDLNELIGKSLSGDLSENEKGELADWIKESEGNADEYKLLSEIFTAPESRPDIFQNEDWEQLKGKIARQENSRSFRLSKSRSLLGWSAAAVLIIAFGFIFWFQNYRTDLNEHFSGTNEILLEDGSQIILYNDGKLTIPTPFNRQIEMTGSAYFIIQRDIHTPFIVKTQNATIKVLGTRFTVRSQEKFTHITVTEGLVTLQKLTGDSTLQILNSGMSGSVSDSLVIRPDLDKKGTDIIQWDNHRLVFRKIPVITLMKEISLHFGVTILIKNQEIKSQTVSGIYEFQTEEGIIQSVCSAMNLQYTKEGSVYTLFK